MVVEKFTGLAKVIGEKRVFKELHGLYLNFTAIFSYCCFI
jgi:hypothetical protein